MLYLFFSYVMLLMIMVQYDWSNNIWQLFFKQATSTMPTEWQLAPMARNMTNISNKRVWGLQLESGKSEHDIVVNLPNLNPPPLKNVFSLLLLNLDIWPVQQCVSLTSEGCFHIHLPKGESFCALILKLSLKPV